MRRLQILSLSLVEKTSLDQLLTLSIPGPQPPGNAHQLILFEERSDSSGQRY